jgi:hypothetical protein
VLDHTVQQGNHPTPRSSLPPSNASSGAPGGGPRTVTADRGYGQKSVEDDLHELGVLDVMIPRKGKPGKARQAAEHRPAFRRTVIWTGYAILAHNLVKIGALPADPPPSTPCWSICKCLTLPMSPGPRTGRASTAGRFVPVPDPS